MLSLDYIEKLTGIKEDWIQNLKETVSALVLAVQLPPQEHICPHCKAATRRVKGCCTRLIKHSPVSYTHLMEGGPIALVKDGDRILVDVPNRRLELLVDEAELARRNSLMPWNLSSLVET